MSSLLDTYKRTSFLVEHPDRLIAIRVGVPNEAVDAVVIDHGATSWAYVTAYNPGSEALADPENEDRHARLLTFLSNAPFAWMEGWGIPDRGDWPPERSLFIIGISREETLELGRRFGQNAILVGEVGSAPELILCAPA